MVCRSDDWIAEMSGLTLVVSVTLFWVMYCTTVPSSLVSVTRSIRAAFSSGEL